MINKVYNLNLDIKQTLPYKTNIQFVQNDIQVNILNIQMYEKNNILDISNVSRVVINFKKPDNTVVISDVEIVAGKITYTLGTQEISVAGDVLSTIEFYGFNGERLTSSEFIFNVRKSLATDDVIESSSEFPVLSKLFLVEASEEARKEAESTRIEQELLRQNNEQTRQNNESLRIQAYNNNESRFSGIEGNISELEQNIANNTQNISGLQEGTNINTNNISILQGTVSTNTQDINTNKQNISTLQSNVSDLQQSTTTNTNNITTLQQNVNTINNTTIPGLKYYKWKEQKTVPSGSNSLTLTNTYTAGQELLIMDTKYSANWLNGIHWNISGQKITFTESSFTESFTFIIYNLG